MLTDATTQNGNGALRDVDVDIALEAFVRRERERLGLDAGEAKEQWVDAMVDPSFTAQQRPHTTLLVGGLTLAHDYLIEGALRGQGYDVRALDCPDNDALRHGKEFGNRAQCNPTYFTVGNLVKELIRLRDQEGMSPQDIVNRYVFVTAGACGPCRFGMYVTEYRKALRDAGFDGFRVMLFQQTGGLKQATGDELGLRFDPPFFIALCKALLAGDLINLMAYRIRPYEVEPGATDRAMQRSKDLAYAALEHGTSVLWALRQAKKAFAAVEVDRLRPKPKVAVIGEFWAMTTEGDGNYHLQRFLEQEGAEVDIQTLVNWLLYTIWEGRHDTLERMRLRGEDRGRWGLAGVDAGTRLGALFVGELALRVAFRVFAAAIGLRGQHLPDMDEIARVGHSFYNNELRGGEGHMEVAKLITNVVHQKSHMTVSVKPFGCMPSSGVSDGVQSVVTERYPEAIFCAVETSGDGAVNFYSRVQMFLFKAKQRAQQELDAALRQHGVTAAQVRQHLASSRHGSPLYKAPHRVAGSAADLVHQVGPLIGKGPLERAQVHAMRLAEQLIELARHDGPALARRARASAPFAPAAGRWLYEEARDALGSRAAMRRSSPLPNKNTMASSSTAEPNT
jgi:predicted nucleotide-binding protein (sugar kinase/HSP70/actin superfamily)